MRFLILNKEFMYIAYDGIEHNTRAEALTENVEVKRSILINLDNIHSAKIDRIISLYSGSSEEINDFTFFDDMIKTNPSFSTLWKHKTLYLETVFTESAATRDACLFIMMTEKDGTSSQMHIFGPNPLINKLQKLLETEAVVGGRLLDKGEYEENGVLRPSLDKYNPEHYLLLPPEILSCNDYSHDVHILGIRIRHDEK